MLLNQHKGLAAKLAIIGLNAINGLHRKSKTLSREVARHATA
jgi:hypothetical protein